MAKLVHEVILAWINTHDHTKVIHAELTPYVPATKQVLFEQIRS